MGISEMRQKAQQKIAESRAERASQTAGSSATDTLVEFRAIKGGIRPRVRVTPGGLSYEQRYANWLTWLIVCITAGLAFFGWPWIQFGKRSVTIPKAMVQGVEVNQGVSWATLTVRSTAETVSFRTDVALAEQARNILLA
jgi:hypothetical protein